MKWKYKIFSAILLAAVLPFSLSWSSQESKAAQMSTDKRVEWLQTQVVPIKSQDINSNFSDLEPLAKNFEGVRLVGLGEATHGTQDFNKLRSRLVKYLVSEKGFRYIILEEEIGKAVAIDQYITTGRGTVQQALAPMLVYWQEEDYVILLEWLRSWNKQHPNDMVHFYGNDAQSWEAVEDVLRAQLASNTEARKALDEVKSYGTKLNNFLSFDKTSLAKLTEAEVEKQSQELKTGMRKAILKLDPFITANGKTVAERFRRLLYTNLLGYIDNTEPLLNYYIATEQWSKLGKRFSELTLQGDPREKSLSSNALAIADLEGSNTKGIYWAHNQHVGRGYSFGGTPSSGNVIADKLGDAYFAVGTDFYSGQFLAFDLDTFKLKNFTKNGLKSSSLSSKLNQLGYEQLWLTLRGRSSNNPDEVWLFDPLKQYVIGGSHSDNELQLAQLGGEFKLSVFPKRFDAVLFVKNTTAAKVDQRV